MSGSLFIDFFGTCGKNRKLIGDLGAQLRLHPCLLGTRHTRIDFIKRPFSCCPLCVSCVLILDFISIDRGHASVTSYLQ
jgi:hypothetical protein